MSEKEKLPTEFSPAERASTEEIQRQFLKINSLTLVKEFLNSVPSMSVVLNAQRQIVYGNQSFLDFLGFEDFPEFIEKRFGEAMDCIHADTLLGQRPGEAVGCVHAEESSGCGTTIFCRTCGAVKSILESQQTNKLSEHECRMTHHTDEGEAALDLHVWSKPINIEGEVFTVFSVKDISDEKRRKALERIFFHDIMNTAGGIQGLANILKEKNISAEEHENIAELLDLSSHELIEEINMQKMLSAAERGDLVADYSAIHSMETIQAVRQQFASHEVARNKHIVIAPDSIDTTLITDPTLLRRVIVNLLKNALEASAPGDTVTLQTRQNGQTICFSVHNPSVMPMDIQLQIFNRSFSTKGSGRGLGTYSIKLLGERYLKGRVSFISTGAEGTVFRICLPSNVDLAQIYSK